MKHISTLSKAEIEEIQRLLNSHGFNLKVDGICGEKTLKAFKDFKSQNYLEFPEYIGETTYRVLRRQTVHSHCLVNTRTLDLIKEFEGLSLKSYLCPAGVPTIGYGNTFYPNKTRVKLGETITKDAADEMLILTVNEFATMCLKLVKVPLTENQLGALTSLMFNIGITAFKNSTLLKVLNRRDYNKAANEFLRWNKANGKTLQGLIRRREAERNLFLT